VYVVHIVFCKIIIILAAIVIIGIGQKWSEASDKISVFSVYSRRRSY